MTDRPDRDAGMSTPADRVDRIIQEQLRIMEHQLRLMRAVETAQGASLRSDATTTPPADDAGTRSANGLTHANALPGLGWSPEPDVTRVPMTDAQRDVWINCQLSGEGSAAFNLSTTLSLRGDLDVEALRAALRRLVERHESLRATIDDAGDHMIVHWGGDADLAFMDLSGDSETERARTITAFLDAELTNPYDLVAGPLFRATLIRSGGAEHTLVLSAHHLICDGWSFGILHRDLGSIYSRLVSGEPAPLDEPVPFRDYAAWRVDQSAAAKPYWLGLYEDRPAQLDLPADKARLPVRTFEYGTDRAVIGSGLLAEVRDLAVAQGVTPFMVLLGAWEILLHRLSGQHAFASGVFVSGQASMGVRDLVGLCANLVPLLVRISPEERLADYLTRLKQSTYQAFDNQHYSLGDLATALQVPRDASRPVLVSTAMTLETPTQGIHFEGLQAAESVHGRRSFGAFDLEAYLTESKDDLTIDLQYSKGLFEPDTMHRWLGYYLHLLEQMITGAAAPVADLRLLDDAERQGILTRWNATESPIPGLATHQRIEEQAARHPERTAIRASGGALTYAELNARANRLARHLRDLGVGADRLVGVHVDRSPDMLVALLAVHKAGGAYVPLDPFFPDERLAMIASDAGLHVLVTQRSLVGTIPAGSAAVVAMDVDVPPVDEQDGSDLGIPIGAADLAYVIYTSGSTGRPKGVEIPHVALTNLLESMRLRPGLEADDVLLAVTTMSFDIAALELFLPLIAGGTVVLADEQEAVDAIWLRQRLAAGDVTVMQATPATWQLLIEAGWTGTPGLKALCGGEALSPDLAAALRPRVASLWNMYGPTETTIWSSVSEVPRGGGRISIGEPIANTQLHVLDPMLDVQPLGVSGELYIGGDGLARGYRGRDDLTAERFLVHRFGDEPLRRLYRTGDVVRRLPDGRIEYLGRADFQVKIRGFRIELGEIETVLSRHPGVAECAVVARGRDDGSKRLVGYIVPTGDGVDDVSAIRAYLRQTLPEYMVPAQFVILDAFPLTANRKVDRARLPDPEDQRLAPSTELVEPRTEAEATLARIWEDLLGLDRVGVNDNFFDLGGDSLLALRCIMRANRSGMSLAPISIFRHQTIAELAEAAAVASGSAVVDQGVVTGPTPLTPAQLRFLNERRTPDPHQWNVSGIVRAERLDPAALRTAIHAILRHHDALRLRLWQDQGEWQQEIAAPSDLMPLESHDLSGLSTAERDAAIERICTGLQGSFDLGQGLLLRAAHFDCGPGEPDRLFVTIHHFAVDGLTWDVFWEDLEQAYQQAVAGVSVSLPPKTTSFREWAKQLERLAESPRVLDTADVWLRMPWDEVARLPTDFDADRHANTNDSAAVVEIELSARDTQRLLDSRRRPEHLIITALADRLSDWTASRTVLIDVLSHGRDAAFDEVNLSRTVCFTLSYNPLILGHPTWGGTPEVLESVVRQIEGAPEGFSFELLRFLSPDQGLRDRLTALPRAELLFNYAGADTGPAHDALWTPSPERTGPEESPRGLRQYPIAVRASLTPNLRLTFVYSRALHTASTIEARVAQVAATISNLLDPSLVTS